MALADFQAFIQQALTNYDPTIDITAGSPADTNVVQPILNRLGTDPFTVDIGLFVQTLLNQQFPDIPTKEGDAITDLLIKPIVVLWNPLVREITRIKNGQSFADPTLLTVDEASALGANLFDAPVTGGQSTGVARIYFAQPQSASISPANFFTDNQGQHFFPTAIQSIRVQEMLLNVENSLYYFDVNVISEAAGSSYNILPNALVSIANLSSAVRVANKLRFRDGVDSETAVEFVNRAQQDLTERSLVTQRGISATLSSQFPDISGLGVVGFNDPPMQRDILTGGGLGPILVAGSLLMTVPDGQNAVLTRRVTTSELFNGQPIDFTAIIGPAGLPPSGFVLTLLSGFPVGSVPSIRDIDVQNVVDAQTLDLEDQLLAYGQSNIGWILRAKTLSLSGIPGGILFPNQPDGTVVVPSNQIHIGGCVDVFVSGDTFDQMTLTVNDLTDDDPILQGEEAQLSGSTLIELADLVLGVSYSNNDATYQALATATTNNLSVQLLDPPVAGEYRILGVTQQPGTSPVLTVTPSFTTVSGNFRWKLSASITVDLVEPKNTKISGTDLATVQGVNVVSTLSGTDFADFGVAQNDVLRLLSGNLVVGDYVIQQVLSPLFDRLQVDRALPASVSNVRYTIFTPNSSGGIVLPFVRVDTVALLDTSGQPVGTNIPLASPIDTESSGFANSAHGIKADLPDGVLGLVTQRLLAGANVTGLSVTISWPSAAPQWPAPISFVVGFTGVNPISLTSIAAQINAQVSIATGGLVTRLAVLLDNGARIGLLPVSPSVQMVNSFGDPMLQLLGFSGAVATSRDVTSLEQRPDGGWSVLRPALDAFFDVVQVLDGTQVGAYDMTRTGQVVPNAPFNGAVYDPIRTGVDFNPEVGRHIQVGSRSLGKARVFFLDPTSFEIDQDTRFTSTTSNGSKLVYKPDPTSNYQRIPALPSGVKPMDGETGGIINNRTIASLSSDFIAAGIQPGDLLVVDFIPVLGTVVLADPVAGLATTTLLLSLGGGPDKKIIFVNDSTSIASTDVTRAGVVKQINNIVGQNICSLTAGNQLQFNPTSSLILRAAGTANTLLGFNTLLDTSNDSPNKGTYTIFFVVVDGLVVDRDFPAGVTDVTNQQFSVLRAGVQRIVSTAMSTQTDVGGLYYFDVVLVSQGTGDQYNLGDNVPMVATGYRSDGYYLTTDDPNLTFSPIEKPKIHFSRSILAVGVSDDPANATLLSGQNVQITYDQSSLAGDVNAFITADTERVVNASPLGRHLIPYFVRFTLSYQGGSAPSVTVPHLQTLIQGLAATDSLEVSDIEKTLLNDGALVVDNPITLLAVIHNFDRSVTVERSQDKLNTGVLAAFVPDVLQVTQRTT